MTKEGGGVFKMRKLSLLFVGLLSTLCLSSCNDTSEHITNYSDVNDGLTVLCDHYIGDYSHVRFIRDTYTDNIYMTYFEKRGYGGGGGICPYYNAEGKIMKYDEFKIVHVH